MKFRKQSILPEIDGDSLKLAREAFGFSPKELAAKLCLSERHITQLENNQLAIFFTPAHKVQVAKKVGNFLKLPDEAYLIRKAIDEESLTKTEAPDHTDHSVITSHKTVIKPRIFLVPTLAIGVATLGIGTQIDSKELSIPELTHLISLKLPMSQLHTLTTKKPSLSLPNGNTEAVDLKAEVNNIKNPPPLDDCSFHESDLIQYQTINPSKKGEMIYVLSKEHQTVCVIDNQNKVTPLDLAAGDSKTVYGQAPFTIVSADLSKFDVYFQGWKVKPSTPNARAIRLEEADYLASN